MNHTEQLKQFHKGKAMLPYPTKGRHYVLHGVKLVNNLPKGIYSMTVDYVNRNNHGQLFSAFIKEPLLVEAMKQIETLPPNDRFNVKNKCEDLSKKEAKVIFDNIPKGYMLINMTNAKLGEYVEINDVNYIDKCSSIKLINKKSLWLKLKGKTYSLESCES